MSCKFNVICFFMFFQIIFNSSFNSVTAIDNKQQSTNVCNVDINGTNVIKNVGDIWNSTNRCVKYICDNSSNGNPTIKDLGENCHVECDGAEYEIIKNEGDCCGSCVQIKCKLDNKMYSIGDSWKSDDNCTLHECVSSNDKPEVLFYRKTCPLLSECRSENIYTKDCCSYCKNTSGPGESSKNYAPMTDSDLDSDYMNLDTYYNHPCVRDCVENGPPMQCNYTFKLEWYETLSKACYDCPNNVEDCQRPHCIAADGTRRSVLIINRMMPGPQIEVCFGDTIRVDVVNNLMGESTSIHWHGLHQRVNPFMDGVPHISQCAISPGNTFRYEFTADLSGTHFWHSHLGMQRGDGALGALIIKSPKSIDRHAHLYDYDLSNEHVVILQDWAHIPGVSMFSSHHHSIGDNKPPNILINGKGRYFEKGTNEPTSAIPPAPAALTTPTTTSATTASLTTPSTTFTTTEKITGIDDNFPEHPIFVEVGIVDKVDIETTVAPITTLPPDVGFVQAESDPNMKVIIPDVNETKPDQNESNENERQPSVTYITSNRQKRRHERSITLYSSESSIIPFHVYNVKKDKRYRFRLINAEFLNCPMELSIDDHNVTVIASDGYDIEPVEVETFVSYAGERFDFIVNANQKVGNYWIRLKGLMDCGMEFTQAYQVAILRYDTAPETEPDVLPYYSYERKGLQLNALNRGGGYEDSLTIPELKSAYPDDEKISRDKPDYKYYIYYDFYGKDNPHFHVPGLYGFDQVTNKSNKLYTPQLNHITMKNPPVPVMSNLDLMDDSLFCNETSLAAKGINCRTEFCECTHVIQVPFDSVVELVLVDEGFTFDANHPFHLHGNSFRVIGMDRLNSSIPVEDVKKYDEAGHMKRNLIKAPLKDTVTIPDGGYTIIRFRADNPGYWLFHCHIEFHAEIGMALIFKVGEHSQMVKKPYNFPTCYDFYPSLEPRKSNGVRINLFVPVWLLIIFKLFL